MIPVGMIDGTGEWRLHNEGGKEEEEEEAGGRIMSEDDGSG